MKKFLVLFISIIMLFTSVGCSSSSIDPEKQKMADIYMSIAMQTLDKAGLAVHGEIGASLFSISAPDKKTETTDEGAIDNIKRNAKDAAGIMYLLSILYTSEGFETQDGLACFDVNYTFQQEDIFQTMNMYSSIDKQNNKVYFEVMVITPKYNTNGYTNAEFTYNFNTSTLIDCRFIMQWDEVYVDMMLTYDQKYMWYETETADEFTESVDQMISTFNSKCEKVEKLENNFGDQMTAYLQFSYSVQDKPAEQPSKPGQGDIVIEGGGMVDKNETQISPEDAQVSEQVWNDCLDFTKIDKIAFTVSEKQEAFVVSSIHYQFDGNKACKSIIDYSTGRETSIFYEIVGNNYYRYDIVKTDIDMKVNKISISETQYYQEIGKVKIDFSNYLAYEKFYFYEQAKCYNPVEPIDNIDYAEVSFYKNQITGINIISQGKGYQIDNFYINQISVEIPQW